MANQASLAAQLRELRAQIEKIGREHGAAQGVINGVGAIGSSQPVAASWFPGFINGTAQFQGKMQ